MRRIFFYLIILTVFGLILFVDDRGPSWLHTFVALYLFIVISFINFGIGYELGIRAPTDVYSLRSEWSDAFLIRLRKYIIHAFSVGLLERRSKLDNQGLRAKSRLDAERDEVRKNLDKSN